MIWPLNVRPAREQDEDALIDLLRGLEKDNNSFGFDIDWDRVREHVEMGARQKGGMHGVIDGDDDVIAASIGLIFDRWWFSGEWGLAQLWFFVRPEYRGRGYERDLVAWAKCVREELEEAAGHRIRLVHVVISQKRLQAKLRLWGRAGRMIGLIGGIFEIG